MTLTLQLPSRETITAASFEAFMIEVWADETAPSGDGGMLVWHKHGQAVYDKWHNAKVAARYFGARRTGGTLLAGERAEVYTFQDGSRAIITASGGAVAPSKQRFGSRRKRNSH